MNKTAVITGITGQDGAYLAEYLLKKGYTVFGTYRRLSTPNFWRLQYLDIFDRITLIPCDLIDSESLIEALDISKPDEIYNLAAQSYVGASFEQPISTGEISGLGVTRVIESARKISPNARIYQASTSELYGNNKYGIQNEDTPFSPSSPYACAKLYSHAISKVYREGYGMYISCGILFNHESAIRGLEFVTRKISNGVAKISLNLQEKLKLGNIGAKRDWGYAVDYVEAMWLMLQQDNPGDYVIATNESHSVKEFAEEAFSLLNLNYQDHLEIDKKYMRPAEIQNLCGDYSKAKTELGWSPKTRFHSLVGIMVNEDLNRWRRWQSGERFPWDAQNYPSEDRILSRTLRIDR